jgi:hypothetical protein
MKTPFTSIVIAAACLFGAGGCTTTPPPVAHYVEASPPARPVRTNTAVMGAVPMDERPETGFSDEIEPTLGEANRVWASGSTVRAEYVQATRLVLLTLNRPLRGEDRMRLSVIALQHAMVGDDTDSLRQGVTHWQTAFEQVHRVPKPGEIEIFLLALRRLHRELPAELVQLAAPELRPFLVQNQF